MDKRARKKIKKKLRAKLNNAKDHKSAEDGMGDIMKSLKITQT